MSEAFDMKPQPLKRPMENTGSDMAALNSLIGLVNNPNITGAEVPKTVTAAIVVPEPVQVQVPEAKPLASNAGSRSDTLFFTGRFQVGKDYVAAAAGAKIFGFADPLYQLATYCYGIEVTANQNKDVPGMREMLQILGQWGRGTLNVKYPVTPARAVFVSWVRSLSASIAPESLVDWADYGRNENIWLDACLRRVAIYREANPGVRVAITNARFKNEIEVLKSTGWRHFHVMCSPNTWQTRLAKTGLTMESPTVRDISETTAMQMDSDVTQRISSNRTGKKLAVIWNDTLVPAISERLHTLDSFVKSLPTSVQHQPVSYE